jgi:predicted nucleic acid-binding protein
MIAYIDASVLLRIALSQPHPLREWSRIERGVSSALIRTESLRTLDRVRRHAALSDAAMAERRATLHALLDALELIEIDSGILERAAQPLPTDVGTLDAIHLASALLFQETTGCPLVMATHDGALGLAARAHGLSVVGL